jgi:hypothetical protein
VASVLAFDSVRKTVNFRLSAEQDTSGRVLFNGAYRGARTLSVPQGWRVTIAFTNRDGDLPHSASIIDAAPPIPEQLPGPAFPNAETVKVAEGLLESDSDDITFTADRAGQFLIVCGVVGHAQHGQWIVLDVVPALSSPGYR